MRDSVFGYPCPFQSTLSVRRATLTPAECAALTIISIHALREESDDYTPVYGDVAF